MKIIKFQQDNCPPCKMVSQYLDSTGVEYEALDVFENPDKAAQYGVMFSVPVTVLVDDNDEVVQRSEGYKVAELDEIVGTYLNN